MLAQRTLRQLLLVLTITTALVSARPVYADERNLAENTYLVGHIASLDRVAEDAQSIFAAVGAPEKYRTIEAALILATRGHGATGIETTRPMGFAIADVESDEVLYFFLPVRDSATMLEMFDIFDPHPVEANVFQFSVDNLNLRLKFVDKWAFVYNSEHTFSDEFVDPLTLIGETAQEYDAAFTVRLTASAEKSRELITEMVQSLGVPGSIESALNAQFEKLLPECRELVVGYSIDAATREAILDAVLIPNEISTLAVYLKLQQQPENELAFLIDPDAALSIAANMPLGRTLRDGLANSILKPNVTGSSEKAVVPASNERVENPTLLESVPELKRLLAECLANESCHFAVSFNGKQKASAAAIRLTRAKELENVLAAFIEQRKLEQLQVVPAGTAEIEGETVYSFDATELLDDVDAIDALIGIDRVVHVTFLTDVVVAAAGPGSLETIENLIRQFRSPQNPHTESLPAVKQNLSMKHFVNDPTEDDEFGRILFDNFQNHDTLQTTLHFSSTNIRLRMHFEEAYQLLPAKGYAIFIDEFSTHNLVLLGYLLSGPPSIEEPPDDTTEPKP